MTHQSAPELPNLLSASFALHRIGWLAFQDLCSAVAEDVLKRPVQSFLPTNDAGRDGAFVGTWDDPTHGGTSTVQCKFTSKETSNLSISMLKDELEKATRLAARGLASDYIIMTNHSITGASELVIKDAFEKAGVGRCRVFHKEWLTSRIKASPHLRMLVPRLYGLGDFADVLDSRAHEQAQLILSEMSDNLEKLVVTKAYRESVRAVNEHSVVLLLGSPAAGKSTIAASLALGSVDKWKCSTIKVTSPEALRERIDPKGNQFFWIDDAWGSTQYQGDRSEAWNQVFPFMQASLKRGTKYLITSRDYIWERAKKDLKLAAMPALTRHQVIIRVQDLTIDEKARILYNHLKFGQQPAKFLSDVKPLLPTIAALPEFLPEIARRLGNPFFTGGLNLNIANVVRFFREPKQFLEDTLENLEDGHLAAIALIFLNGGIVRSPVPKDQLQMIGDTFGIDAGKIKDFLMSLRDSLLLLADDEHGPYWTYKHPTISDAFAAHVAKSPELVEIYLKGAKPNSILGEVICAGESMYGASVTIPDSLHDLLAARISNAESYRLRSFLNYRANKSFATKLLAIRSDLIPVAWHFTAPLSEDSDVTLFRRLFEFGFLTEEDRKKFVGEVERNVRGFADSSFLNDVDISFLLTPEESSWLLDISEDALRNPYGFLSNLEREWTDEYEPNEYFDDIRSRIQTIAEALSHREDIGLVKERVFSRIDNAVEELLPKYSSPYSGSTSAPKSLTKAGSIEDIFRDVDE